MGRTVKPLPDHVVNAMTAEDQWAFKGTKTLRPSLGYTLTMPLEKQLAWIRKNLRKETGPTPAELRWKLAAAEKRVDTLRRQLTALTGPELAVAA